MQMSLKSYATLKNVYPFSFTFLAPNLNYQQKTNKNDILQNSITVLIRLSVFSYCSGDQGSSRIRQWMIN